MGESYSERGTTGAPGRVGPTVAEPEPSTGAGLVRALLARLLPDADVDLLVAALLSERDAGIEPPAAVAAPVRRDSELSPPLRELRRVRLQLALGEAARSVQHAINNPLTALLAEAQLLEMEPLADDQRASVGRIVELARRLVAVSRSLDSDANEERGTRK
jgi:signal transduction histidine kinase